MPQVEQRTLSVGELLERQRVAQRVARKRVSSEELYMQQIIKNLEDRLKLLIELDK